MLNPNPTRGRLGLLAVRDFRHLWMADILSQVGTRLSLLAVPLLALYTLEATTFEVALLRVIATSAALLLGLPAGAWVDRLRCRPLLVLADVGRAVLLGYVAVAAVTGWLTYVELLVAVFAVGVLTVGFDIAHQAYLPRLVESRDLVEGNTKLAANHAIGAVVGAGTGGPLIQWFTTPAVVVMDALTYVWSAVWLRTIRRREVRPTRPDGSRLRTEIAAGLRFVGRNRVLLAVAGATATTIVFQGASDAVMIVFLVREVGLGPAAIGLLGMTGLLGAIASSLVTARISARIGVARALLFATPLNGVGFLLFAVTDSGWRLIVYVVAGLLTSFCIIVMRVLGATCWQLLSPDEMRGRVGATMEFVAMGAMPAGALVGGIIATLIGLRPTLVVNGVGMILGAFWLVASPLRGRRDLPRG